MPPGPVLPVGLTLVFVYAAAIGLLKTLVPVPEQYTFENVNIVFNTLLFLCVYGVGNALGYWMPLVKIKSEKETT